MEDENKTLAEMVAERKAVARTIEEKAELLPIMMSSLKNQSNLKKASQEHSKMLQNVINSDARKHIATLGRLNKYEDTVQEVIQFALDKYFWIECDSSVIGLGSVVKEYENAKGKKHLAHFSYNGKYMKKAKSLDEKPINYKGNFSYAHFRDRFNKRLISVEGKTFEKFEDLFELTPRGSSI